MTDQPSVHTTEASTAPSSAPGTTSGSWLKKGLAWALGLGLLAWLLAHTPFAQVAEAFERPDWLTWLLTLTGLLVSYVLRAARLQVVLNLEGHHKAPHRWLGVRTDALRVILMHNAAINLLPMRAGELSFPWLASRELGMPVARAVACLLWMRVQDVITLAVLGLLLWPGLPLWMRLTGFAGMAAGWLALGHWSRRWFARHAGETQASGKLASLMLKLRQALLEPEHHHPLAWLATLANWSLKLAAGACLLSAVSTAPWLTSWAGALGGELAAIVPLQGPAGFGTYEAGVWAGMAAHLPPQSTALAHAVSAALALHVCFLLCAVLAGALASVLTWANKPRLRQGTPSARLPD